MSHQQLRSYGDGTSVKSHLKDWRSPRSNSQPLVYKASSLTSTPRRLLGFQINWPYKLYIKLVHKGGKIKNWGGECITPTKSLSQNIRVDVNREVKFL